MQDPTIYKPVTAWRTIPKNVVILTKETELLPATYQMNVTAIDRHDIGANIVDEGYYFMSYMGNVYKVLSVAGMSIEVEDSFRVGKCPTSGKTGIIYKSVGDGKSPFLAPIFYQYLHETALARSKRFELGILWNKLYSEKYLLDPLKWKQNAFNVLVEFGQALGLDHLVNGEQSTAIGQGAVANSFRELVLGSYAKDTTALSSTVWNALDLLYTLGNGADSGSRSNALEIYKSGLAKFYNAIQVGEYVHPLVDPVNGMIQYTDLDGWQKWVDTEWVALGQEEYIYLAYASDDVGTGFTLDPESKLPYEAKLKSSVKIVSPVVGDFAGLWRFNLPEALKDGKQYVRKDGAWEVDNDVKTMIDFVTTAELYFVYNCPQAMIFTSQEYESSAAVIDPPLNTPLAKFDKVLITVTETQGIILNGMAL